MKTLRWSPLVVVSLVAVVAGACSSAPAPASESAAPASSASASAPAADKEWTMPNKNLAATRYSGLTEINTENVKNLRAAWTFSTGVLRGHEGEPIVIGSTMYLATPFPNIVYALDLSKEGAPVKWKYSPKQDAAVIPIACCDTVNRGVTYDNGKVFFNQLDTTTVALDAETGKELWKVKQGDYRQGQTITNAPMVVKGKVISGISGGEFGVRGFVTANDVNTGKQVWRMYSTGPEAEVGFPGSVETWKGDEWKRGGGTTWGWYSYDPELDLFYYGTGNPGSWNPDQRPGDNKYSMTIFARNPDTGKAAWAYQKTPHDAWDYDGINENVLADVSINGQTRKVLVNFDRNGFSYVLDRKTGELLQANAFGAVNWATSIDLKTGKPVENPEKRTSASKNTKDICPSAMGAKNQQPVSYSPRTGFFYVPDQQPVHGLRGRGGEVPGRPAVRGRDRRQQAGPRRQPRRVHRLGSQHRQEGVGHQGEPLHLGRRAVHGRRRRVLRHDGRLAQGGQCQDRRRAVEVQDAVGHHRQPDDLRRPRRQAVRRDPVGHRRLVGHRRRRRDGPRGSDGRTRRHRRLQRPGQLQQPGRRAVGVLAALENLTLEILTMSQVFYAPPKPGPPTRVSQRVGVVEAGQSNTALARRSLHARRSEAQPR